MTKKKVAPKKAVPKKKTVKKNDSPVKMKFIKTTKKGEEIVEGTLIRKLNYKGQEYFLIQPSSGEKRYMNAKYLDILS